MRMCGVQSTNNLIRVVPSRLLSQLASTFDCWMWSTYSKKLVINDCGKDSKACLQIFLPVSYGWMAFTEHVRVNPWEYCAAMDESFMYLVISVLVNPIDCFSISHAFIFTHHRIHSLVVLAREYHNVRLTHNTNLVPVSHTLKDLIVTYGVDHSTTWDNRDGMMEGIQRKLAIWYQHLTWKRMKDSGSMPHTSRFVAAMVPKVYSWMIHPPKKTMNILDGTMCHAHMMRLGLHIFRDI